MGTPIDPKDVLALGRVHIRATTEANRSGLRSIDQFQAGVAAVARAVLPDGYVAVPVTDEPMIPVSRVKQVIGELQDYIEYNAAAYPVGTNVSSHKGGLDACAHIWNELFPESEGE